MSRGDARGGCAHLGKITEPTGTCDDWGMRDTWHTVHQTHAKRRWSMLLNYEEIATIVDVVTEVLGKGNSKAIKRQLDSVRICPVNLS